MCIKCFKVPVSYRWIILLSMACFSSSHLRKPACTTSTVSTTTALATTSITTFAPTISPKKSCFKRTRQSAQLTIPKRQAPTLSLFISTDIRLKCHKKSPLPFAHHRTSLTTHPTTSYTSSTTLTTKTPPNTKMQPRLYSPPPPLLYTIFPPLSPRPLLPLLSSTPPPTLLPSTPPPSPHEYKSYPSWSYLSLNQALHTLSIIDHTLVIIHPTLPYLSWYLAGTQAIGTLGGLLPG